MYTVTVLFTTQRFLGSFRETVVVTSLEDTDVKPVLNKLLPEGDKVREILLIDGVTSTAL